MFPTVNPKIFMNVHRVAPKLWIGGHVNQPELVKQAHFDYWFQVAKELPLCTHPLVDDDLTKDVLNDFLLAANDVIERLKMGGRVLVTCAQGRNRSAFVAALAMTQFHRMSGKKAVEQILNSRKVPGVFSNTDFKTFMESKL